MKEWGNGQEVRSKPTDEPWGHESIGQMDGSKLRASKVENVLGEKKGDRDHIQKRGIFQTHCQCRV
jgi:hypothetical protein